MNCISPERREQVVALLMTPGMTIRRAAEKAEVAPLTVMSIRRTLTLPNCTCGRPGGHKGWCKPRFDNSEERQAMMERIRATRRLGKAGTESRIVDSKEEQPFKKFIDQAHEVVRMRREELGLPEWDFKTRCAAPYMAKDTKWGKILDWLVGVDVDRDYLVNSPVDIDIHQFANQLRSMLNSSTKTFRFHWNVKVRLEEPSRPSAQYRIFVRKGQAWKSLMEEEQKMSTSPVVGQLASGSSTECCELCKAAGFVNILAHYKSVAASKSHNGERQPAMCYDHRHGKTPRHILAQQKKLDEAAKAIDDSSKVTADMSEDLEAEDTKVEVVPPVPSGMKRCREFSNFGCQNLVAESYKIGMCSPCQKRLQVGLYSPERKKRKYTHHEETSVGAAQLPASLLDKFWNKLTSDEKVTAITEIWDSLSVDIKLKLVNAGLGVDE